MRRRIDQATSLRPLRPDAGRLRGRPADPLRPPGAAPRLAPPLLAVVSGKGGVGKTFLAINLALAFRELGRRPFLIDLDGGLANVDVALGLAPQHHVGHVLTGECSLDEALIEHEGLILLPNGCGQADLAEMNADTWSALLQEALCARPDRDFVVADTHPGIGVIPIEVATRATITVIVSTPEPTALTDTYALFKVLGETTMRGSAGLVVNQASSPDQAREAADHLDAVSRRFLGRGITYWGHVLQDAAVTRSIRQQRALLAVAPRSAASHTIRQVAATLAALLAAERRALEDANGSVPGGRLD